MGKTEKDLSELSKQEKKMEIQEKEENEPDVILEVPKVKANALKMEAENLSFTISVKAQLTNLSNIEIGTDIHIEKIKLDIDSLEAEAMFRVKLKKIENIFLKALEDLDNNPRIIKYAKMKLKEDGKKDKDGKDGNDDKD